MTDRKQLARHVDNRHRIYVPWSVGYLDDPDWSKASAHAQLVYFRGTLHAKRAAMGGVVSLHVVTGGLWGVMAPEDVAAAAQELVAAEKWKQLDDDTFLVVSYQYHNGVEGDSGAIKRRSDAIRGNHIRWHVNRDQPDEDCEYCYPPETTDSQVNEGASPPESGANRGRIGGESLEVEREAESDVKKPSSAPASNRALELSAEELHRARETVEDALDLLGYEVATISDPEVRTVARAHRRGATPDLVLDLADRSVQANEPRAYWLTCVSASNSNLGEPEPLDAQPWFEQWTLITELIQTCGADGWYDDGRVVLSPEGWQAGYDARRSIKDDPIPRARNNYRDTYLANAARHDEELTA